MVISTRQCLLKLNIKEILFFLKYSFQREECISQLQVCLFDRNPEGGEHPSIYTDSFLSIPHYLPWRREARSRTRYFGAPEASRVRRRKRSHPVRRQKSGRKVEGLIDPSTSQQCLVSVTSCAHAPERALLRPRFPHTQPKR